MWPSFFICEYPLGLLASGRTVQLNSVTHVSQEVLQVTEVLALGLVRLGTHLLEAAAEATVQRALLTPFGTIYRPTGGMPKGRAENVGTQVLTGGLHVAGSAVEIELAATCEVDSLAVVVGGKCVIVGNLDVGKFAA